MVIITGHSLKEMRERLGITQQQLAFRVGVSQAHIAKIENEKVNPTLSTVNKIMSVLKESKGVKCESIMKRDIISIRPNENVSKAVKQMVDFQISQLPVIEKGLCWGSLTEKEIMKNMDKNFKKTLVREIMGKPFPIIGVEEDLEIVKALLEHTSAVLVSEKEKIVGIITKSDLLNLKKE